MTKFQKGHKHSDETRKKLSYSAKKRDPKTRITVWTEEKVKMIKEFYPKLGIVATAKLLKLTPNAINVKASKLKLKIDKNEQNKRKHDYMIGENNPMWKNAKKEVICGCGCGEKFLAYQKSKDKPIQLYFKNRNHYEIWFKSHPEISPLWKGGITGEYIRARVSKRYMVWRNKVLKRDNFVCQYCHSTNKRILHAHHIQSFLLYKELRFNVDNGITLCKGCHMLVHSINILSQQ